CDQNTDSYYAKELKKLDIEIYEGHDAAHLTDDVDYVAVSPALFDINPDNPELKLAEERGILMTWQEFMGRYLQKDKRVIAVSGTHGKTTTTFMTAEVLIDAGLDPSVEGGSVYKKWGSGGRYGESNLFLCEADEFNRNFLHYHPEIAVINNAEMDHPECYNSFEEVLESFRVFVTEGGKLRTLILNGDSEGAVEVLRRAAKTGKLAGVRVAAFTRNADFDAALPEITVEKVLYGTLKKTPEETCFFMENAAGRREFPMRLTGEYNVSNAVAAILIAETYGAPEDSIRGTLSAFTGVGRRFDLVGTVDGVPVYDDYAHHPTEIRSVLTMCRDYYPERKLLAVFEPHQISRLRLMFDDYTAALGIADEIIIMRTHIGREVHKNVSPISKAEWEAADPHITQEDDTDKVVAMVKERIEKHSCGIVIVIGAAGSYRISRAVCEDAPKGAV
ncbi:MAG: hypothetical protein IKR59_02020, partial [Lachnospiraceae bacterium]|nr:hypothetical protein [Lachnospiraceae bacterium]